MFGSTRVLIDADYHRIGAHLIQPFRGEQVQPASYDVTLSSRILVPAAPEPLARGAYCIDLRKDDPGKHMEAIELNEEGYLLMSGQCLLAATREQVACPNDMIASVDGKSTIGRCWIAIHATAGFIDAGFCGAVTLEVMNHGPWGFVLYPGMRIGQLRFHWLGVEVDKPYGSPGLGSHYQGSVSVRAAEKLGGP